MILIRLQGGCLNQVFQWALYRSLKIKGCEVYLETSFFNEQSFRRFELSNFHNLRYEIYSGQNNGKTFQQIGDSFIYQDFANTLSKDNNYFLNGYWQSEKYFKDIEHIIREELAPSSQKQFEIIEKYSLDVLNNAVSIHVRRTDYLHQQQNHPVQPIEYYNKALELLKDDYKYILVFSDDIEWCKQNFKYDNIVFVEGNSNIDDIYIMSMVKHNIIANSSFSWWSAWLNSNPAKKVISPTNWFGSALNLPIVDLIPEKWFKI